MYHHLWQKQKIIVSHKKETFQENLFFLENKIMIKTELKKNVFLGGRKKNFLAFFFFVKKPWEIIIIIIILMCQI